MKALRKTVASLLAAVDGEIEEMKVEVVPASRTYGLASLPDEMLLRILNFVVASYEWTDDWWSVRKELLRVTQVSQRFRRCASAAQGMFVNRVATVSGWNSRSNTNDNFVVVSYGMRRWPISSGLP